MSYLDEIIRQHTLAKQDFGANYEFATKQRDILHLAKIAFQETKAKRTKTEYHIKKTKREIEKLYKHLTQLGDKLEELIQAEDQQLDFLQAVLSVKVEEDLF